MHQVKFATILLSLGAGALLLSFAALAAGDPPQVGLWKLTMSPQTGNAAARTQNQCMTKEMLNNMSKAFGLPTCNQRSAWNGSALRTRLDCRDLDAQTAITIFLEIIFDTPQHYSGAITSSGFVGGRSADGVVTLDAQRIGECEH